MTTSAVTPETVEKLRLEFDRSFQSLPRLTHTKPVDYLVLRTRTMRHAIALRDVASLHTNVAVTRLPTIVPGLLGICSIRSELVAVFDLATCLNHPRPEATRWFLRVAGTATAFAVEHLERHVRLEQEPQDSSQSIYVDGSTPIATLSLTTLAHRVSAHGQAR